MRKHRSSKLLALVTTLAFLGLGYYFTGQPHAAPITPSLTHVRHHVHHMIKTTLGQPDTKPNGASVPRDATDTQLLALSFDITKYPENYANLGKATLTDLQIHDALEHNHEQAWYSVDSLDDLGRSGAGQALVTYDSVSATAAMKRPPFSETADPTGFRGNNRIAQLIGYRGYFYNRSHTIAWSLVGNLGGGATSSNAIMQRDNLTTGTRAQNVGTNGRSEQTAGGMAYAETSIRDFVRAHPNIPVYYVVTPLYQGTELVPRGTHVQAVSATDNGATLNINVYVFNAQNGAQIDYATGAWSQS
ncbi:DNA/RNA non-specific endonuclease [Furfurilactobacillus siliginis]|uniref:DNA-entry nuclease n=1 Tax=Furfurilactobacillus siliginis TaxID=348151 RepID=A0A0R2LBR0_9LACO|nr:DNA/RNA non-specific endonuclease [Furfurilactobacillus siliginis]KRN97221.1 hypothetical protein IV55_GL000146 [Furfurilactobacillus siliginis]GEK29127.1 hypothetical protein LSI01_14380 [Furfurilactobacillus siliginis]